MTLPPCRHFDHLHQAGGCPGGPRPCLILPRAPALRVGQRGFETEHNYIKKYVTSYLMLFWARRVLAASPGIPPPRKLFIHTHLPANKPQWT